MKIAPLMWELHRRPGVFPYLVHTGQHYDERMSKLFFEELHIPRPDLDLGVGSGSHAVQTAEVMKRFEPVVLEQKPDAVLVVGDVNSTLACALTSVKLDVPVAHVEAGLRSFDRTMPEEINRILTDAVSRWLFVTERSGVENLRREGVPEERIFLVGNVMIDTLLSCRQRCETSPILEQLGVRSGGYAVLTLHRPANVDDPSVFRRLFTAIARLARELPIVFPVHPRHAQGAGEQRRGPHVRPETDGAVGVSGLHEIDGARPTGVDGLRRRPGGDDGAWRAVPDAAKQHRTADHLRAGDQSAGGPRSGADHRRGTGRSGPADRERAHAGAVGRQGGGADRG